MNDKNFITIAIPIFNEGKGLVGLINETLALPFKKEIIIIDDGSRNEETLKILQEISNKYPEVIILTNKINLGKSASVQLALKSAKGNLFVVLDGDAELNPKDIILLYSALLKEHARLANGARIISRAKRLPFTQIVTRFAKAMFGFLVSFFYGTKIKDVLSGYKLFYTQDLRNHTFSTKRFGLELDLLVTTLNNKRKIVEVDVEYHPRSYKQGKRINIFDSAEIFLCLLRNIKINKSIFQTPFGVLIIALGLWIITFSIYNLHANSSSTSDSLPNNFTTVNILYNNRLDMTNFIPYFNKRHQKSVVTKNKDGIFFAKTPVINGILAVPYFSVFDKLYGVSNVSAEKFLRRDYETYYQSVGKYYAAFLTSVSVFVVFLTLYAFFANLPYSFLGALAYAFATMIYSTAAQGNWQHGPSILLVSASFYLFFFFLKSRRQFLLVSISLLLSLAALIRISNIFFFVAIISVLLFYKSYRKFIPAALITFIVVLSIWNIFAIWTGIPGGYNGEVIQSLRSFNLFYMIKVIISLLISPNVGLLIFNPLSILGFIGAYKVLRNILKSKQNRSEPLFIFLVISILSFFFLFLFNSVWWAWEGGFSFGPRLLTEGVPFLTYLGAYFAYSLKRNAVRPLFIFIFATLFFYSVLVHAVGVYANDNEWHNLYYKEGVDRMTMAWQMRPSILWYYIMQRKTFFTQKIIKENERIAIQKKYYYIDPFYLKFTTKKISKKYI